MSNGRRRHHHVVPKLHLRGFATPEKRIVQLDLDTGNRREVSITDAAVISDFYTVVLPDGRRSDTWEQWLSDVENEIAPALKRASTSTAFQLTDGDRERLARWIALQFLRGPDNRRQIAEAASFTTRAQVGIGGLAYLQHAMSRGLGRDVPLVEAERAWDDITAPDGPEITISGDDHLEIFAPAYDRATELVYNRSWSRIRFNRHSLAVSDAPVYLVPGDQYHEAGLSGARAIAIPLDRQTILWLDHAGESGPRQDRSRDPSTLFARAHNEATVLSAERFLYFHPDDNPVPADATIPRPRPQRLQVSGGLDLVNRDRPLQDVLDQIATHTRHPDSLIANYTWPLTGYHPPSQ